MNKIELTDNEKNEFQFIYGFNEVPKDIFNYINELLKDRYERGFETGWKGAGGDIKEGIKIVISNPKNSDILKALGKL